ncbi:MAG: hypothetical protein PHS97_01060 [Oscillospiraceae bacterium]|nr:hypothetical protein [Oscillospiraceae bacterium]
MKEIKIMESSMREALAQIDALESLSPKDSGCLRLLTEEMFSLCGALLDVDALDYSVKREGKRYALRVSTETGVNEQAREQLLSLSSSGKNAANKGIKGLLGAVLEVMSIGYAPELCSPAWTCGMLTPDDGYAYQWTLSQYMELAPKENVKSEWDGMEKSIIANFADDVSIGVRSGKLEMTVTKTF